MEQQKSLQLVTLIRTIPSMSDGLVSVSSSCTLYLKARKERESERVVLK